MTGSVCYEYSIMTQFSCSQVLRANSAIRKRALSAVCALLLVPAFSEDRFTIEFCTLDL